jgi:hypothetical protein
VLSLKGKRVHGRPRVAAVLQVSKPVQARFTLLFRGRAVAAKRAEIAARRSVTLASRRRRPAGRYVLRIRLVPKTGAPQTLSVPFRLK